MATIELIIPGGVVGESYGEAEGVLLTDKSAALKVVRYDPAGTPIAAPTTLPGSGGVQQTSNAGRTNTGVPLGSAAAAIKTGAGRLASILVTTAGTVADTITDGSSGTIIALLPATIAAGAEVKVDRTFATSLYHVGGVGTPAFTVSYD